ncbi:NrfD/PsrC family molybdoenzyme membrane anchor subunit [Thiofilum flexile]|uniref:NrfD/PsrC family molybdoenzyme membrane anchor subunit n=1 Tax=Thiofilum flexile TaxID=125627 RepID=UPI0003812315|nr:NrfD/PsrC family molybdoenzyme membrane anchor subunit [Thiofilum flexile]
MSNKAIVYSEVQQSGWGYYGVLMAGMALVGLGLIAFFYLEHTGHYVTGMNNQIVWGLPHVFAIFLIVAASGILNIGSIGTVFNNKAYQPLGRLSGLLAISCLIGGLMVLVLDLGRPDRLIIAMTHYNFKSIFAWNIILYNGFLALVGLYVWAMMDHKIQYLYKPVGFAAFFWRLVLTAGTGSIFGFLVAREAYDSAIFAPLFILISFALGLALFILISYVLFTGAQRVLSKDLLKRKRYLLALFMGAVLFFEAIFHITALYAAEHSHFEQFILSGASGYSLWFWLGHIVLGSIVPLCLLLLPWWREQVSSLLGAAALVVMGSFIQLYVIIIGGQAYPLTLFPNATVESSFFDGVIHTYTPTVWELMLGVGGVGVTLVMIMIGVKVLRFLPVSLATAASGDIE